MRRSYFMTKIAQQFATDGFAIWLSGSLSKFDYDIHINEWLLPQSNSYIDIGIRLYNTKNLSDCYIYVPYIFTLNELNDLSLTLANENIARGIFNANCSIKSSSNSPIIEIEYNGRKENIISLSSTSLNIENIGQGTLLTIPITPVIHRLVHDESYLRFRLPHKTLDVFFHTKKHNYKFQFESPVITERYNYVIKLNEVRSLPFEIRNIFTKAQQNINKVITTLSVNEQYIVDDSFCYKVRHLEEDLYANYVPDVFSCSNVIVYQWYIKDKSHYNFNIKIDYSHIMWRSFFLYAFLFILFTFLGNILWKLLSLIPYLSWLA